jgi:hypothetical protein
MARVRAAVVLFVVLALVCVPLSGDAAPRVKKRCGLGSQLAVNGKEGTTRVASYTVVASWCVETSRGAATSTNGTRKGRRGALVSCMTDFAVAVQTKTVNDGVDFLRATTKQIEGDDCAGRAYRIEGRFGEDYIDNVPSGARSLIVLPLLGSTFEVYPLGRVGAFDITVRFTPNGGACERCTPDFDFCDLRVFAATSTSCVRL